MRSLSTRAAVRPFRHSVDMTPTPCLPNFPDAGAALALDANVDYDDGATNGTLSYSVRAGANAVTVCVVLSLFYCTTY